MSSSNETTPPDAPGASPVVEKTEQTMDASTTWSRKGWGDGLQQMDEMILRLDKLLASPGGLSAFLSSFNYYLYLLAYLQTKSPSMSSFARKWLALIRPAKNGGLSTRTSVLSGTALPSMTAFATLVSKARTTLRLFGLFPLYAWLRTLVTGPKPHTDSILHSIAVLQASSYFTYQALENICLLADCGVVPASFISALNRGDSKTARLYVLAFRCWLGGISCDFLRLAREWQLESRQRVVRARLQSNGHAIAISQDDDDARFDRKWWIDLMAACAWFPMALHFSSDSGGIPGWNMGWMGACGLLAGSARMKALWESTK